MLRNRIAETSVAPGTATTINLAGAMTNRAPFIGSFVSGSDVFYVMDDGSQSEAGYGVVTSGAPNTLTRTTVLWNSSTGRVSPARLNFTGTTTVFCDVPAERNIYADKNLLTALPGAATIAGALTVTGASTLAGGGSFDSGTGYQKLPGGIILQWGSSTTSTGGTIVQNFPIVFPTQCFLAIPQLTGSAASGSYTIMTGSVNAAGAGFYGYLNGTLTSGLGFNYWAVGN